MMAIALHEIFDSTVEFSLTASVRLYKQVQRYSVRQLMTLLQTPDRNPKRQRGMAI